ncbi:WG repeat-containing protein [Planctomycetaceae bacterium SH139]
MLGRIGRYDVERLIGSGGMGVVLKAFDTELNRPVAIKLLAPYLASSGAARQRFSREARAAAAVMHPNVVPIYNVETEQVSPFIVMKYVSGESLQARIDRDGQLQLREILRIGMQVADGLSAAHLQGLVHRDIKPSNILLEEEVDRALISDFGLARAADDARLTRTGFHPGTPQYMSPEQASGQAVDARSDLFSLGSMLYTMCTGRPPFRAENSLSVMRRITDSEPTPIREINPDIPEWLTRIVLRLMCKDKTDRLQSALQVHELLEAYLSHVQAPQTNPLPLVPAYLGSTSKNALHPWLRGKIGMKITFAGCCLLAGSLLQTAIQTFIAQPAMQQNVMLATPESGGQESEQRGQEDTAKPTVDADRMLFDMTINGKHGFIDQTGNIVIPPSYEQVYPFSDGLAAVQIAGRWGFINGQNQIVISPQYIQVGLFSDGLAPVKLYRFNDRWGFIDTAGNMVIQPRFDYTESFHDGIARVGMVSPKGLLLSMIADIGPELSYHYIDSNGKEVSKPPPEHYATGEPKELIPFRSGELVGYVNAKGDVVIEPQFKIGQKFSDGLAGVRQDRLLGYINREGEFVIPPTFQYGNEFSEGLAGVQLDGNKWGFIDKNGKVAIPAAYDWIYRGFRQGIAKVTVAGRIGYVNKNGEWVW